MDDTLYPEIDFVMSGFQRVSSYIANKYNLQEKRIFEYLKKDFENGIRGNNYNRLLNEFSLKIPVKKLVRIHREHIPSISLFPDTKRLLEKLSNLKFSMGLITEGNALTQQNKINKLGIKSYFDYIIVIDTLEDNFRKTSCKPFKTMLKKLGIKPNQSVYIGDNPKKDFIACHKLNIHSIRIIRKNGIYKDYIDKKNDAKHTVYSLSEIINIIEKLCMEDESG